MLGFSKSFVAFLIIALILAFGFRDSLNPVITFMKVIGVFIVIKIIWNILTK